MRARWVVVLVAFFVHSIVISYAISGSCAKIIQQKHKRVPLSFRWSASIPNQFWSEIRAKKCSDIGY
jgi:hypothetical protein